MAQAVQGYCSPEIRLEKKIKVSVLMGNPFAARELPELPCIIYGYDGGASAVAVIEALAGDFTPSGKLPVKIM